MLTFLYTCRWKTFYTCRIEIKQDDGYDRLNLLQLHHVSIAGPITFDLSPPNFSMLFCIHCKANRWSSRPWFPRTCSPVSLTARNPSTPATEQDFLSDEIKSLSRPNSCNGLGQTRRRSNSKCISRMKKRLTYKSRQSFSTRSGSSQ